MPATGSQPAASQPSASTQPRQTQPAERGLHTAEALREALKRAGPGDVVLVGAGVVLDDDLHVTGVAGSPDAPVQIRGVPGGGPHLICKGGGLRLSNARWVELSGLVFQQHARPCLRIDDADHTGGAEGIVLEELRFVQHESRRPGDSADVVTLWGVDDFIVRDCSFAGWNGAAIDIVACRRGLVDRCTLEGDETLRQARGVQIRAGSRDVLVQRCYFGRAGQRVVSIGGHSNARHFRRRQPGLEAEGVIVAGNRFHGGQAPIVWNSCGWSWVHHNLFHEPEWHLIRLLQENAWPEIPPCRGGLFERNVVVTSGRLRSLASAGDDTRLGGIAFRGNAWFQLDAEGPPRLPTPDLGGIYQVPVDVSAAGTPRMHIASDDERLADLGPGAYTPQEPAGPAGRLKLPSLPAETPIAPVRGDGLPGWMWLTVVVLLLLAAVGVGSKVRRRMLARRRHRHARHRRRREQLSQ
ncbi:MAG: hypothetical protein ACOC93_02525 [Planctomycetota bacterium]